MVIFGQFDEGGDPPAMARQVQGFRFDLHVGFHLDVVSDRGEQPAVEPYVFALDAARGVGFGDQVAGKVVEEDRGPAFGRFHGPLAQGVVDVFAQDGLAFGWASASHIGRKWLLSRPKEWCSQLSDMPLGYCLF